MTLYSIVGSTAAKSHFKDFREPEDLDIISPFKFNKADVHWHPGLQIILDENKVIPSPETLLTLKMSHAFWDIQWSKTIHDIMFFQNKGVEYNEPMLVSLYAIWEDVHGRKKVNLNASPDDFFNKKVKRIYEHDSIHDSIAYYDRPLFYEILKDGHQVNVDREKWENLLYPDKLMCVREEVYATALERLIIPSDYTYSPMGAYKWALMKTVTSFSKGWFPLFIVENIRELYRPDIDFVKRHRDNSSKLIPLKEG